MRTGIVSISALFLLYFCAISVSTPETSGNEEVCNIIDSLTVISDFSQEDCPQGTYLFENKDNCFPKCVAVDKTKPDMKCKNLPCLPGYKCEGEGTTSKCVVDNDSCFKYHYSFEDRAGQILNDYAKSLSKPECLKDGTWAPKQCKGEVNNGRCFCSGPRGNRIFGHAWSNQAENMTCACSRRKAELMARPDIEFVGLHCDELGNYEPLQCHDGFCWCAETKTGDVRSKVVTASMMKLLPCYSKKLNGEQYLRQCESQQRAQAIFLKQMAIHGTTEVHMDPIDCDYDGTYGPIKIENGFKRCAWKDNKDLSEGVPLTNEASLTLNCNCARDTKLFELIGQKRPLECLVNGNYKPLQKKTIGSVTTYFCVDSDGFQKNYEPLENPIDDTVCDKYF